MNNKNESLNETFEREEQYDTSNTDYITESVVTELANERPVEPKKHKIKNVKKAVGIAGIAMVVAISALVISKSGSKKNDKIQKNTTTTTTTTKNVTTSYPKNENLDEVLITTTAVPKNIDDLGIIVTTTNSTSNSSNVNGDVIVTDSEGNNWKDEASKEKYESAKNDPNSVVSTDKNGDEVIVSVDTKDDSLHVVSGTVYEKHDDYEIKDTSGNIISSGTLEENSDIPKGYAYDEVLGEIVPESEVNKYVKLTCDYYSGEDKIFEKGDIVTKETYERIKKDFTTTPTAPKVVVSEEFVPVTTTTTTKVTTTTPKVTTTTTKTTTTSIIQEEGKVNADGTYTIYGTTYESKEDFEQFLLTPEEYGFYNGIIMSLDTIEKLINQQTK